MKNKLLAGFLFAVISFTSTGQDINYPDLQGFKKLTNYPVYLPENLWDFINGAADGFLALGFRDLHVVEYKKGKNVIKLEIYRHQDHTMAFGIYASERSSSFAFTSLGAQGYSVDGATNFFKGNYYVKIRTYSDKPKVVQSTGILAQRVANMLPGETTMPALLSKFPAEGRMINEETYIHDNVLGHQFLSSAFQARYTAGNDVFGIYLIRKDNPDEILKIAKTYLAAAGMESFLEDENRFVFTDGYNGTIFLSWKDNMMIIIQGLAKDQADLAYKYTTEILK